MAVENDYNLLVFNLNELAKTINGIRDEVERRRLQEARDHLEPNQTNWVNLVALQFPLIESTAYHLLDGATSVLRSRPGEAVFTDQPPAAPDQYPEHTESSGDE